jgi:zinc protease
VRTCTLATLSLATVLFATSADAKVPARNGGSPKTVLLPSAGSPLVSIRLVFRTGAVDDPKGKEGLAALTAAMLGKGGTREHAYPEVLDALYPMAAEIHLRADKEATVFEGTVHRDNLAAYAQMLTAQILEPRFAEEDFTRNRQEALDYLTKTLRGNDDENLGKQALAASMYRGHPYGRPTAGTVAGVSGLTLEDVRQFYASHFTRDRLIVGVAGGYPDTFAAGFAAAFAGLPAHGAKVVHLPAVPQARGQSLLVVEKGARANAISIGQPIRVTRADADFYPLVVAASYLGEHRTFTGVLMKNMRGKRGLNYGDYGYVENFIQQGGSVFPVPNIPRRQQHFEIWIRPVPPHNTGFAIREAIFETEKLVREGIPADGFEATRRFLMNYKNLWTQDASRRLGYAIDAVIIGRDIQAELETRLPTMTKAEVDAAVRKYLDPRRLAIAVVSDKAEELATQLSSGKATPIVYDTKGTPADILAEDKTIEALPLQLPRSTMTVIPVDKMFER